jgi:hypothetical protein
MADDNRRVESRIAMLGQGMGTTPEKIEELEARRAQMERAHRPPPTKKFSEVFASSLEAANLALEEEERAPEPSTGRRAMGNLTAYQRSLLGMDELDEGDGDHELSKVLIKG